MSTVYEYPWRLLFVSLYVCQDRNKDWCARVTSITSYCTDNFIKKNHTLLRADFLRLLLAIP